jgi:hypothetical protein
MMYCIRGKTTLLQCAAEDNVQMRAVTNTAMNLKVSVKVQLLDDLSNCLLLKKTSSLTILCT